MMLTESIRDPFAHLNAGFDQIEVKSAPLLGVTRFQRPRRTLADFTGSCSKPLCQSGWSKATGNRASPAKVRPWAAA